MTPKIKGYDTPITMRITADLKTRCMDEAKKHNLTLNEWLNRTLETALNQTESEDTVSDDEIDLWYSQEFTEKQNTEMKKPDTKEFIKIATKELLGTYRCPHCGEMNLGRATHCGNCGKKITWQHPDQPVAKRVYDEFVKAHPPKKPCFKYVFSTPTSFARGSPFLILENNENEPEHYKFVKEIRTDELVKMKQQLEKEMKEGTGETEEKQE